MKRLLLYMVVFVMLSFSGYAQTVHFMLFAATNDNGPDGLGAPSRTTKAYFESTFATLIRQCGFNLDAQYYYDTKFTKGELETALLNLRSNSNDVIIFYFTGHGFNDRRPNCPNPNEYPTILLGITGTPKPPRMKSELDIFNILRNKPHKLLLTIAEACNKEDGASKSGGSISIKTLSEEDVDLDRFRQLFLLSGDYLVSSSIRGEYSYADDIGFFTHSFISVLEKKTSKTCHDNLSWDSIFADISTHTTEYARKQKDREGNTCIQHPQWKRYGDISPGPDALAQYNKGVSYYNAQNYTEAVKCFRNAANQGHAGAQFWLGYCYHRGFGVEQEDIFAAPWFEKAAKQGHAAAQFYYGVCCEYGFRGQTANVEEAYEWYKKSAAQGNANAIKKLNNKK